jgi:hypothetical protein
MHEYNREFCKVPHNRKQKEEEAEEEEEEEEEEAEEEGRYSNEELNV